MLDPAVVFSWAHFVLTHENVLAALEFLEKFITIGVLPVALIAFFKDRKKEHEEVAAVRAAAERDRNARQYLTYDALDDRYGEFLKLMVQTAVLPVYPANTVLTVANLNDRQKRRYLAAFELLISIFERAFLMFRTPDISSNTAQWQGWKACMFSWRQRLGWDEIFKAVNGEQFDADFVQYIDRLAQSPAATAASALVDPSEVASTAVTPPGATGVFQKPYETISQWVLAHGMWLIPGTFVLLLGIYWSAPSKEVAAAQDCSGAQAPATGPR